MTSHSAALATIEQELNARGSEDKIDPTLERMHILLDMLGNPHLAYPTIHIAGTNGKTSTSRMIDALATQFSLRTGRNTSPHLHSVTERICVDGEPISAEEYCCIYEEISPFVQLVDQQSSHGKLSKFEIITAMAFMVFAQAPVDVAIIETGLGGIWDATNVVSSQIAVLTPIGHDHQQYLGNTIEAIAREKAGIIKSRDTLGFEQIVLTAEQIPEAMQVIVDTCAYQEAIIAREGSEFMVRERLIAVGGQMLTLQGLGGLYEDIFLPLHGKHQAYNAVIALATVEAFFGAGKEKQLNIDSIRQGFAQVSSPGRLERIAANPTVLVDAAHNPHGAKALAQAILEEFHFVYSVGVIAVLADKDAYGILTALEPVFHEVVITANDSARALDAQLLYDMAVKIYGTSRVHIQPNIVTAIAEAIEIVNSHASIFTETGERVGGGVIVTGSVVTTAQARAALGAEGGVFSA